MLRVLSGLDNSRIARLLRISEWRTLDAGASLTREAEEVDELYFLCSGRAVVEVRGVTVAHLEGGSFVGEVAFLTGGTATASVKIDEAARILVFPRGQLEHLCSTDDTIGRVIHQLLGRDLALKMRHTSREIRGGEISPE